MGKELAYDKSSVRTQEPVACVFCQRIANNEYEDRFANHVMFEPINPVTEGHRLVVPVPHTPHLNTGELEPDQTGWALRYFTNDLEQYNIITSKGSDATQTIQHLHFHIVPRTKADGLQLPWSSQAKTKVLARASPKRTLQGSQNDRKG